MKLSTVRIQNYRVFKDETIFLGEFNSFVGANGSGKSTVLSALNILFRNTTSPTNVISLNEEDFHLKDTSQDIKITVTFSELSAEAKEDLSAYVRQNTLVISVKAKWDSQKEIADVKQYGSRMVMQKFTDFFEKLKNEKLDVLKTSYAEIRTEFPDLPDVGVKARMEAALRDYEESRPDLCTLVESEDQFYGWNKADNKLAKYCQWVYIPAVKDAMDERDEGKTTALGQLLQRSTRTKVNFDETLTELKKGLEGSYKQIIEQNDEFLRELSSSIEQRLRQWSHPEARVKLNWHYDPLKSLVVNEPIARVLIGEGQFLGELARLGHGLQRSFIVALLQELASTSDISSPTLLLGIEEPELYQHPPQARHLSTLLEQLSAESQIFITTHSPYFISGKGFECIRLFKKDYTTGVSKVTQLSYPELSKILALALNESPKSPSALLATIEQLLQPTQNEMFFAAVPIFVEGLEDVAMISTYLHITNLWLEFRRLGCHFVIAEGKGRLSRPLAISVGLGIPTFTIFDSDADNKKHEDQKRNTKDNSCILRLCGQHSFDPLPDKTFWSNNVVMWETNIADVVKRDIGTEVWERAQQETRNEEGFVDVSQKNSMLIAGTLERLWTQGTQSNILKRLCEEIISFAKNPHSRSSNVSHLEVATTREDAQS